MKNARHLKWVVVLVLLVVLMFSTQTAKLSNRLSSNFSAGLYQAAKSIGFAENQEADSDKIQQINFIVRNLAHSVLYFFVSLGILHYLYRKYGKLSKMILWTLLLVLLIAFIDEGIQSFIPGRGAEIKDVVSDFMGALVGCLVYAVYAR